MKAIQFEIMFDNTDDKLSLLESIGFEKHESYSSVLFHKRVGDFVITGYDSYDYVKVSISEFAALGSIRRWDEMKEFDIESLIESANIPELLSLFEEQPQYITIYTLQDYTQDLIDSGWDDKYGLRVYQKDNMSYNRPSGSNHLWLQDSDIEDAANYVSVLKNAGFKI